MGVSPDGLVEVMVDAVKRGTTCVELVTLAVWRATEKRPDAFGVVEDQTD